MQRRCNCFSTEKTIVPIQTIQQSLKNDCGWNYNDERFVRDTYNLRNEMIENQQEVKKSQKQQLYYYDSYY